MVARQAHNLEVAGSIPASATKFVLFKLFVVMKKVCAFIESTVGWLIWCITTIWSFASAAMLGGNLTKGVVVVAAFLSGYWFVKEFCHTTNDDDAPVEVDESKTEIKPIGFKQGGTKAKKATKVTTRSKKAKEQ